MTKKGGDMPIKVLESAAALLHYNPP